MTPEPVEIHVMDKKVRLLQPAEGFRTSLDSVMLAAACPARAGESVLDMGCGVGGASFCLLHRVPECVMTGIEIQPAYATLANRNKALNINTERCVFICGDVCGYTVENASVRFDHVICNPPYMEAGAHTRSPVEGKAVALGFCPHPSSQGSDTLSRGEREEPAKREGEGINDWLDAAFRNLKSGGSLTMIHRADMTDKIILGLGRRFGAIEIIPLWPRPGEAAKRVIIRALKDRKTSATLHAGLVLHEADGSYTAAADAVLRSGAGLFLDRT
jgi:tRNA1(Val) A37 N6-methylase TrmN6